MSRARDLYDLLRHMSDSEFTVIASGDDGEQLLGRIVGVLGDLLDRATDARRAEGVLHRIVAATHSHINGRDLLAELHPRRSLDIKRRVDGVETWFEGDWLSGVWDAVKDAKALLYSRDMSRRASDSDGSRMAETNEDAARSEAGPARAAAASPNTDSPTTRTADTPEGGVK